MIKVAKEFPGLVHSAYDNFPTEAVKDGAIKCAEVAVPLTTEAAKKVGEVGVFASILALKGIQMSLSTASTGVNFFIEKLNDIRESHSQNDKHHHDSHQDYYGHREATHSNPQDTSSGLTTSSVSSGNQSIPACDDIDEAEC